MTFFTPGRHRVAALSIRVLVAPSYDSKLDDQALLGEEVDVLEIMGEFSRIRIRYSGKTGWVASAAQKLVAIGAGSPDPTHRIAIPRAITFRHPDPESETMVTLPLNAQLTLGDREVYCGDEFARVLGLPGNMEAWVRTSALIPLSRELDSKEPSIDFVDVQESLIGTPYVWGGRDATSGMDCARLLGESLRTAGQDYCPGDTRDQVDSTWLGKEIEYPPRGIGLRRGDLIFWKGHVATMVSHSHCIHATDLKPYHRVLVQELSTVIRERIVKKKGMVLRVRRFERYRREQLKGLVA